MMGRMEPDIDNIYLTLIKDLVHAPSVGNTRELNNVKLVLNNIDNNIVSIRDMSYTYLFGELLWYFSGNRSLEFISKFSSFWNRVSDDGVTCNSAYGYLMHHAFGFDQIEKVIELLTVDPSSRRAKINLNTPNKNIIDTHDEPCTMSLHFLIRNNKLHCTGIMRSNDIWFGLPYDIAFFTELQKYIAHRLGIEYGSYTHFVVSLHLYDRNYDDVMKIINNPVCKKVTWDREKFYENYEAIAAMVKAATKKCTADQVKNITMNFIKEYFDFKEINNENQDN